MKNLILLLFFLPLFAFSQNPPTSSPVNNYRPTIDHHQEARSAAYTSMIVTGVGVVMGVGIASTDPDNAAAAGGVILVAGVVSLVYRIKAWHHIGEAGKQTALYIEPEGLTLALTF